MAARRNLEKTMESLEQAYTFKPVLEVRLLQAGYLLSAGLYQEAAAILDAIPDAFGRLDVELHSKEIDAMKKIIQKHQQKAG